MIKGRVRKRTLPFLRSVTGGASVCPLEIVNVEDVRLAAGHEVAVGARRAGDDELIEAAGLGFPVVEVEFELCVDHPVAGRALVDEERPVGDDLTLFGRSGFLRVPGAGVLYFEGDRNMSYRILRAVKNRYGSTNEIGVFEMLDSGLSQVENPSLMLISGRPKNTSGTCIACAMEGTRPILAEVQALVSASSFGNPRRMATGFDYSRMAMLLAVLEKRAGYFFGNMDAYINVIGGLKLDEPATDLSVALALISSLKDVPIRDDVLAFGEIGLGGEIRSVNHCEQRIKEAARLGFKTCIIPRHNFKSVPDKLKKEIEVIGVKNVYEAFANCVD